MLTSMNNCKAIHQDFQEYVNEYKIAHTYPSGFILKMLISINNLIPIYQDFSEYVDEYN